MLYDIGVVVLGCAIYHWGRERYERWRMSRPPMW